MPERVKRITMFKADEPPFDKYGAELGSLKEKDLVAVRDDGTISVCPAAAAEDISNPERQVIYRLLGYEATDDATPLIAKRAGVVGGRAAVAGTRIPVWQVAQALEAGADSADFREQFGLSDEQIAQATAYADAHPDEIRRDIFDNAVTSRKSA